MSEAYEEVVEEIVDDVVEEPEAPEEDFEGRAKRMGWVPESEYRGDKSRWVDAKTFVERGENELPILRERLRDQDKKFTEVRDEIRALVRKQGEAERRGYERAMEEVRQRQREAVATGDQAAFDAAEKQREELAKALNDKPQEQQEHPEFVAWKSRNQWYTTDMEMQAYADSAGVFVSRTRPHLVGTPEFFDAVDQQVRQRYPHKFENPRRSAPAAVEGGGRAPAPRGKKGFTDLPPEAKAACNKFVSQGIMTKEEYVKEFFGE